VAPGADPSTIRFAVESKVDVKVDSQGNLILDERGELYLNKPLIYQERDHSRTEIAGEYVLLDRRHVGIQVGKYDAALPLIINPSLTYSTYLGGSSGESGYGIAADIFGNAYVTGATWSANFSTASPIQPSHGGGVEDAFVIKIGVGSDLLRRGVQKRIKGRMVR
jgi:hypothetical protein